MHAQHYSRPSGCKLQNCFNCYHLMIVCAIRDSFGNCIEYVLLVVFTQRLLVFSSFIWKTKKKTRKKTLNTFYCCWLMLLFCYFVKCRVSVRACAHPLLHWLIQQWSMSVDFITMKMQIVNTNVIKRKLCRVNQIWTL